jgi:serine/threonine protein kinase
MKEATALLPFSHKNDKQLVKLLATYEIRKGNSTTYYLIFPWAQASVRSLWRTNPAGHEDRRSEYNLRWISGQALAIAEALAYIHEEYAENVPERLNDPDKDNLEKFGRHGDIKAANFLVYEKNKRSNRSLIFLADFGLSRFSRLKTRSMAPPRARSPSYRPPEYDISEGTLSRKSDIWSLGAFFLEFLTWYLRGWDGVNSEFPAFREERDHEGIESDIFFTIQREGDSKTAVVKEKVRQWIDYLHGEEASTQFVHDILDLVGDRMLVVDPNERITAGDLKQALLAIHKKGKKKKEYLTVGCRYARNGRRAA